MTDEDGDEDSEIPTVPANLVEYDPSSNVSDQPLICPDLPQNEAEEILRFKSQYSDIFSDVPGLTTAIDHDIVLSSSERLKSNSYPIPIHLQPHFEKEVDNLLELGIIRPSSPHSSPIVLVKKSNGSYRMTIDNRTLDRVTLFHGPGIIIGIDGKQFLVRHGGVYVLT
ncbi:hypothetical protein Pcinc_010776 [Petrolisthes cinctipes]|uniref:Uncharacterized protein n=1 Tax=Petrolisthes cinctipes TaxID=88211 RepID=A0AAE1KV15_PETCI|nr:hypothetical protein Pcinc_010776 [Petrolisthes cinctipes]